MFTVLVTGDRHWDDPELVWKVLDRLLREHRSLTVVEGGAPGADLCAKNWASGKLNIVHRSFPAQWTVYGKAAGPMRNTQMLRESEPDLVVAFHNDLTQSKGTKDMVSKAKKAGVEVRLYNSLSLLREEHFSI